MASCTDGNAILGIVPEIRMVSPGKDVMSLQTTATGTANRTGKVVALEHGLAPVLVRLSHLSRLAFRGVASAG